MNQLNPNPIQQRNLIKAWPISNLAQNPYFNLAEIQAWAPNSIELLKEWMIFSFGIIPQGQTAILPTGQLVYFNSEQGIELYETYLRYFFDDNKLSLFVDRNESGKFFFIIKTATIKTDPSSFYDTRRECELASFEKAFGYLESFLTKPSKPKAINTESLSKSETSEQTRPTIEVVEPSYEWHNYIYPNSFPERGTWIVEKHTESGKITAPFQFEPHDDDRELNREPGSVIQWAYSPDPPPLGPIQ